MFREEKTMNENEPQPLPSWSYIEVRPKHFEELFLSTFRLWNALDIQSIFVGDSGQNHTTITSSKLAWYM